MKLTAACVAMMLCGQLTLADILPSAHPDTIAFEQKLATLPPLHFTKNRPDLTMDSLPILDQIVALLRETPSIHRLEVAVHTDYRGSERINRWLTQERAQTIADYMQMQGIDSERLEYKGYGSSQPLDDKKTKSARERNRRVEFVVKSASRTLLEQAKR